jgi:hypothetical protein
MKADLAASGTAEMLNDFIEDFLHGLEEDEPEQPKAPPPPAPRGKAKKAAA